MAAFLDGVTRLDDETVARLRRHWDDGWNGADVDVIMAPFAEEVVFQSPFVSKLGGDASSRGTPSTIVGRDALRAYCAAALERTPGIRYTVDDQFVGTDTLVLLYTCHFPDGRPDTTGADLMRIDASGAVAEWRCHYRLAGSA